MHNQHPNTEDEVENDLETGELDPDEIDPAVDPYTDEGADDED